MSTGRPPVRGKVGTTSRPSAAWARSELASDDGGGGGSAGRTGCSGNDKGGGGGGAGGSSHVGGVTGGATVNGVRAGNGQVKITFPVTP
ncbi:MAG TPA: hypothetical protein VM925_08920 [Labilithrix sp.]|nr:hypothetical protein [Labilithrix sp.]